MNIKDFSVGQTVYSLRKQDGWRQEFASEAVREETVQKVGRVYVTTTYSRSNIVRYEHLHLEDGYLIEKTDCGTGRLLFATQRDLERWLESQKLQKEITRAMPQTLRKLSLEQLREIYSIFGLSNEE